MSAPKRSSLITWTTGDRSAPPVLLLHDRYGDHDELDALGAALAGPRRVVSVRSARTQMEGTDIKGYYWFLGPYSRPELSTVGDALEELETLLLLLTLNGGSGKVTVIGKGEGGVMALLLALIWPERLAGIVSIDGPLPDHPELFPVQLHSLGGLPVLLSKPVSVAALTGRGAKVTVMPDDTDPLVAAAAWALTIPS